MTIPETSSEYATKGSQKWLQIAVNRSPSIIDTKLREGLRAAPDAPVSWLSPLTSQNHLEYRDQDFVDQLELKLKKSLNDFWPLRGPMWDGLARVGDTRVLVEAKAHISEMMSGASRAGEKSLKQINEALDAVRKELAPRNTVEWSIWNGPFYQYANRLAHLHFLNKQSDHPIHLVYIYFLNASDVDGVATVAEWQGAIKLIDAYMGLGQHKLQRFVHKLFIDVREIEAIAPQ